MITVQFTPEEIRSLIQTLECEQDQYLREFGSNSFSLIRESAQRAADQNNELIQKLQLSMQQQVPGA
jgi:hypothetical protein